MFWFDGLLIIVEIIWTIENIQNYLGEQFTIFFFLFFYNSLVITDVREQS